MKAKDVVVQKVKKDMQKKINDVSEQAKEILSIHNDPA